LNNAHYDAVIADLEERRAEIDAALVALRRLAGRSDGETPSTVVPMPPVSNYPHRPPGPPICPNCGGRTNSNAHKTKCLKGEPLPAVAPKPLAQTRRARPDAPICPLCQNRTNSKHHREVCVPQHAPVSILPQHEPGEEQPHQHRWQVQLGQEGDGDVERCRCGETRELAKATP
jgi:hypothetical protein